MFRHLICAFACAAVVVGISASSAAEPPAKIPRAKAVVPDGMALLSNTLTGSYFVAAPLKHKYDDLLGRLDVLKRDIDRDRVAGPDAIKGLNELRDTLRELREQLDKTKVLIPAVQAHSQVQTMTFDVGPERIVVITADRVRIVGTDGDKLRCTLEKVFLGGDGKEADAELAAIKVVHRHGIQPDIVGKTAAEGDAEEAEFLKTPDGQKLKPENREKRKKLMDSIRDGWSRYRDFQGKAIDTIHVEGLTWQEGNTQMILEFSAKDGGGGSQRIVWQRHATLTVYVPKCQRIAIRGALAGLEIVGVQGSLLVAHDGNHDRDYDAQFRIKGVRGDVTVSDFPLNEVEDVTGSVTIQSLMDFANSATQHDGDGRLMYWYRPLPCLIKNVGGDLRARFGRVNLRVEDVRGGIVVENDAGDTKVIVGAPLASAAHRLTTVSGTIDVNFGPGALGNLPILAAMNHGTVRTNASQDEFPTFMISGGSEPSRDWHGFRRVVGKNKEESHVDSIGLVENLKPDNESPGLVIRTLAGTIVLTVADK
jgi:hypothetical protein